jgi:hypothetical protein
MISRAALSTIVQGQPKYRSMLAGNSPFIPIPPSDFESIATVTATGGETNLVFTSIPGTYKHLQIRGLARNTYSGAGQLSLRIYFNTINTPSSTSYADKYLMANGSAASATRASVAANFIVQSSQGNDADLANAFGASIIDIHDYAATTKTKTVRYFAGYNMNTTSTDNSLSLGSGLWDSTAAITQITIQNAVIAFKAGSTFALYGIKG